MTLDLLREKGIPLDRQTPLSWSALAGIPTSKLDSDAFTRARIILMNGIEAESLRSKHLLARPMADLRPTLARVRRIEQQQQTLVNWLLPADLSPIETTIAYEQVAIELTAHIAEVEPDPYIAQVHRFGLLEDFDHYYRFAALADRAFGIDANAIGQCYSDIMPGRPTIVEHRAPDDDLRRPYDKHRADPLTKLNALTLVAGETQTHDYYMAIGPMFADPVARRLYAEIASIEEQHVTQYESLTDPTESPLERWLLMEAVEVYNYWSCLEQETDPRIKAIWERCLAQELGHLQVARQAFETIERRDSAEVLPRTLPAPIAWRSHRDFLRRTVSAEAGLRARGSDFVSAREESAATRAYRQAVNADGSPSEAVALGWTWAPGGDLAQPEPVLAGIRRDGTNRGRKP